MHAEVDNTIFTSCAVHVVSNLASDWFSEKPWHLFHEMQPMGLRDLSMQQELLLLDPTEMVRNITSTSPENLYSCIG